MEHMHVCYCEHISVLCVQYVTDTGVRVIVMMAAHGV